KRNALTLGMVEGVRDLLREAAADPDARGVLLAGTGPSTCAGVDLEEFTTAAPDDIRRLIGSLAQACAAARGCPKPVAVAIEGHAPGAIARQKRLVESWLNLPLDEAIERSKEALAGSFEDGVPQRLARERLGAG